MEKIRDTDRKRGRGFSCWVRRTGHVEGGSGEMLGFDGYAELFATGRVLMNA